MARTLWQSSLVRAALVGVVLGTGSALITARVQSDGAHATSRLEHLPKIPPVDPRLLASAPEPEPSEVQVTVEESALGTLTEQRTRLLALLRRELALSDEQAEQVRAIFAGSPIIGQGNPKLTRHPMSRRECREIRAHAPELAPADPGCGAPNMVRIGALEPPASGFVCIDQFEFPNVPCEYPVVHVSAREAVLMCEAIGKRICDAHEWEGACAGEVLPAAREYLWSGSRMLSELRHNEQREHVWAYGKEPNYSICAMGSTKNPKCTSGYYECGSNTYPAGAFPACVSRLGVYDQHGNVAEHMNLPLKASELASAGGHGVTEMKGSWFIFAAFLAHEDDCRWRAPMWHASPILDVQSHSNYHLGFRCCRNVTNDGPHDE